MLEQHDMGFDWMRNLDIDLMDTAVSPARSGSHSTGRVIEANTRHGIAVGRHQKKHIRVRRKAQRSGGYFEIKVV